MITAVHRVCGTDGRLDFRADRFWRSYTRGCIGRYVTHEHTRLQEPAYIDFKSSKSF